MKSAFCFALFLVSASAYQYGGPGLIRVLPEQPLPVEVVHSSYGYGVPSASATLLKEIIPITSLSQTIRSSQLNDLQFTTGNGIAVSDRTEEVARPSIYEDEQGRLIQAPTTLVKSGSVSYTSPEGIPINLNYVADENGFRAEGAHLPLPVEKLPEVVLAEQEHLAAVREAQAKAATLGSLSIVDDHSPLLVAHSYSSSPVVRLVEPVEAPHVIRVDSSYNAPQSRFILRDEHPSVISFAHPTLSY